jgi:hypothetical protein
MAPLHTLLRVVLVYFLAILDAAATPFRHNITALGSLNGTNRTHGNQQHSSLSTIQTSRLLQLVR